MIDSIDTFQYRLRIAAAGALIIACLLLLPFLPRLLWVDPKVQAANNQSVVTAEKTGMNDSPNAITRGMFNGADGLERAVSSTEETVSNSLRFVTSSVGSATVKSGKFVAHSVGGAAKATAGAAGKSVTFIAQGTGNIFSSIADTSIASIIRPADSSKTQVPVIDSNALAHEHSNHDHVHASAAETASQTTTQRQIDSEASWPMHGAVTLEFGVPHWPYQPTHTGIDISARQGIGVTSVKPFKPGVVKQTVHSKVGLGNHVVVDHGGGITSVYAHLSSISVKVGQEVDKGTVLGNEGSTGASTGSHLHFEIRVNGQPVNPRQFISGQP